MDRPVDAPAAEHRFVGGIDDGIDLKSGDVGTKMGQARTGHRLAPTMWPKHRETTITQILKQRHSLLKITSQ